MLMYWISDSFYRHVAIFCTDLVLLELIMILLVTSLFTWIWASAQSLGGFSEIRHDLISVSEQEQGPLVHFLPLSLTLITPAWWDLTPRETPNVCTANVPIMKSLLMEKRNDSELHGLLFGGIHYTENNNYFLLVTTEKHTKS